MRQLQTFNRVLRRLMNLSLRHRKRVINPLAIDKTIRNGIIAMANHAMANHVTENHVTENHAPSETAMADHAMADHARVANGKGAVINAITGNSNLKTVLMTRQLRQTEPT
ncbi:hypothetical protein SAMN06269250_0303 [Spirosoma fluviale]|uniref:Uncharacterized protein n=1 Tax=Spirosoma fluviale TaxID=1597977 RepID=A0A286F4G6_9BACT|nr:hypothetical protein SAMN06269250_0303 [Spirosoma fluviale]